MAHEVIDRSEATGRWPGFAFDGPVLYQPDVGRLWADEAVRALHRQVGIYGAAGRFEEPVRTVAPLGDDQVLVTTDADEYRGRVAVVTAGAWVATLLAGVVELPPLTVTREQVFHFPTRLDGDPAWPSYIHHSSSFIYGLQGRGDEGVKVAEHHRGATTTADGRSFEIDQAGRQRVIDHVRTHMPGLDPTPTSAMTCLYTTTADESFVIERHGPIVVGSPCSGHGFKFAPLVGRRLAHLAMASA